MPNRTIVAASIVCGVLLIAFVLLNADRASSFLFDDGERRRRRQQQSADDATTMPATAAASPHVVRDAADGSFVVRTSYGPIRGELRTSYLGQPFYSFRSVPYARPPLGELRFRDPQPPLPWSEPLDCRHEAAAAPFVDETETAEIATSEDCLLLNVYTGHLPGIESADDGRPSYDRPSAAAQSSTATTATGGAGRPVMVWIHGGAFRVGSGSELMHGPDWLLSQSPPDVVVVTINYRLGALGFLSIDTPAVRVPGNAGLKDQTMALRWVQRNIAAFGGDPANVTLFGNSAGAGSVHLHMLSDLSAGLFQRAIAQSGTALTEWANFPKNDWTRRLARALGWQGTDADDAGLYEFLCAQSAERIVAQQDKILVRDERMAGMFSFGPAVEAYVAEQSFFVEDLRVLAARGPWSRNVALMLGSTSDEGLLVYRAASANVEYFQSVAGFEALVPAEFGLRPGGKESYEVARRIRQYYHCGDEELDERHLRRTMQAWGDKMFWLGVSRSVEARMAERARTRAPTWLYRYAGESGQFNWKKLQFLGEDLPGASHADEVHYLFRCAHLRKELPRNCRELKTMRQMVAMWTQFAATGNPNCPEMGDTVWLPVTEAPTSERPLKCLNIAATLRFIDLPESKRIDFWEQLYSDYGGCRPQQAAQPN